MTLANDWVVGFTDGEGCFFIGIQQHSEMTIGYQVLPEFVVVQHERDIQILHALKRFFGCGVVRKNHGDRQCYRVRKLQDLKKICEFFLHHSLKTKKQVDFRKFRRVILQMEEKKHLEREGLIEIIDTALQMNNAQRDRLKEIRQQLG